MSTDPGRFGNNWTQFYVENVAVRTGVGDPVDKVIERIVSGATGVENTFNGTEQQRNGSDDSYNNQADEDFGEFDL